MAGAQVSTRRMVPVREFAASRPSARTRFAGAALAQPSQPLRPRGVGQILDVAFDRLLARIALSLGVSALAWLPFCILSFSFQTDFMIAASGPGAWLFLSIPAQVVATSLICGVVAGDLLGLQVTLGESLRLGLARFASSVCFAVLSFAVAFPLACLCFFPTLIAFWGLSVGPVVLTLEQGGLFGQTERSRGADLLLVPVRVVWRALSAFSRSFGLVRGWGGFGRWLGWATVTVCLAWPFNLIAAVSSDPSVREFVGEKVALRGGAYDLFSSFLSAFFLGIPTAFIAVVMTVFYVDLRVRKEGLDLERALEHLRPLRRGVTGSTLR